MGRSMPRQLSALAAALMLACRRCFGRRPRPHRSNCPGSAAAIRATSSPTTPIVPIRATDPRYDDPTSAGLGAAVRAHSAPLRRAEPAAAIEAYRPPRSGDAYSPRTRRCLQPAAAPTPRPAVLWPRPEQRLQSAEFLTGRYGQPYTPIRRAAGLRPPLRPAPLQQRRNQARATRPTRSRRPGIGFFGSISKGMASVIEYAFQKQGRPNGYILGQDAGGAFVAGLRYGEGTLYTARCRHPSGLLAGPLDRLRRRRRRAPRSWCWSTTCATPRRSISASAASTARPIVVGGVGLTFQKSGDVVVAPIRAGVGLRLGANIGYLKYTRTPTWNPF